MTPVITGAQAPVGAACATVEIEEVAGSLAAQVMGQAVLRAVKMAKGAGGVPASGAAR